MRPVKFSASSAATWTVSSTTSAFFPRGHAGRLNPKSSGKNTISSMTALPGTSAFGPRRRRPFPSASGMSFRERGRSRRFFPAYWRTRAAYRSTKKTPASWRLPPVISKHRYQRRRPRNSGCCHGAAAKFEQALAPAYWPRKNPLARECSAGHVELDVDAAAASENPARAWKPPLLSSL